MKDNTNDVAARFPESQRLMMLLRFKGLPCQASMRELAVIIGINKDRMNQMINAMDHVMVIVKRGQGSGKSTFSDISTIDFGAEDTKSTKIVERKTPSKRHEVIRNLYGSCVYLSDNEYKSVLEKTGSDKWCEIAINILSAFKEKKKIQDKTTGDYLHIISWVINIIETKKAKAKEQSKQEDIINRYIQEDKQKELELKNKEDYIRSTKTPEQIKIFDLILDTYVDEDWKPAFDFVGIDENVLIKIPQGSLKIYREMFNDDIFVGLEKTFGKSVKILFN